MRNQISCAALGFALIAAAPTANAQTVITREISEQPVETIVTQQPGGMLVAQEPLVTVPSATVVAQPVQTVRTVETVRTIRPIRQAARSAARPLVRRQVVTTRRTIVRQRVVPAQTVIAPAVAPAVAAVYPQPIYDRVVPAPVVAANYPRPVYDEDYDWSAPAAPGPVVTTTPVAEETVVGTPAVYGTPVAAAAPVYRYVYQSDRILVVDANTDAVVQTLPR